MFLSRTHLPVHSWTVRRPDRWVTLHSSGRPECMQTRTGSSSSSTYYGSSHHHWHPPLNYCRAHPMSCVTSHPSPSLLGDNKRPQFDQSRGLDIRIRDSAGCVVASRTYPSQGVQKQPIIPRGLSLPLSPP